MFLKKSSHKGKQRRPSYLFCCFNGSVVAESGDLEKPATAIGKVRKKGVACSSWPSWLRRKKKKKPLKDTSNKHGAKVKIYSSRSIPPALQEPTKFSAAAAAAVGQVNKEPYLTRLPLLTPKYDAQTRPESSNVRTEPVSNRLMSGLPEPEQQAATPFRVSTQARSEWARKLDSKAGLTVIGVALVVMVFYGRAAAVISLCACFYLAAILREPVVAEVEVGKMAGAGYADVDSEEYKKRVVMEGLLDRSKRRLQAHVEKI
ncbi:hypothetical protein IEQ34_008029 [Dendrobium chrysotoxum]|uniref:Reticulon-like protein n=1 Tax=Dendrobium chrysotoxum TaxID=161865 RepID=A0AAV7H527_DENCH|nr:hypothetical protein IEQ34_008029 [Dendrobium chrysotoxum]